MAVPSHVVIKAVAHLGCSVPLIWLLLDVLASDLGPDPAEAVVRRLGFWGITLLWCCLSMTPLRHLTGKSIWIACRRLLGLWAFVYISLHLMSFLVFWCGAEFSVIAEEFAKRPYILLGLTAWLLMIPLAITSTQAARRALGKRWLRLHRLVYLTGLLGLAHLVWIEKLEYSKSIIFGIILIFLFFIRLRARQRKAPSIECASSA